MLGCLYCDRACCRTRGLPCLFDRVLSTRAYGLYQGVTMGVLRFASFTRSMVLPGRASSETWPDVRTTINFKLNRGRTTNPQMNSTVASLYRALLRGTKSGLQRTVRSAIWQRSVTVALGCIEFAWRRQEEAALTVLRFPRREDRSIGTRARAPRMSTGTHCIWAAWRLQAGGPSERPAPPRGHIGQLWQRYG